MSLKLLTPDELKPLLRNPEEFKTFKELKDYYHKLHIEYVNPWHRVNLKKAGELSALLEQTYLNKLRSFPTEEILAYKYEG